MIGKPKKTSSREAQLVDEISLQKEMILDLRLRCTNESLRLASLRDSWHSLCKLLGLPKDASDDDVREFLSDIRLTLNIALPYLVCEDAPGCKCTRNILAKVVKETVASSSNYPNTVSLFSGQRAKYRI